MDAMRRRLQTRDVLHRAADRLEVTVTGTVTDIRHVRTRNGTATAFFSLRRDGDRPPIEVVAFAKRMLHAHGLPGLGDRVTVRGRLDRDGPIVVTRRLDAATPEERGGAS
jgi:hypothetical protein